MVSTYAYTAGQLTSVEYFGSVGGWENYRNLRAVWQAMAADPGNHTAQEIAAKAAAVDATTPAVTNTYDRLGRQVRGTSVPLVNGPASAPLAQTLYAYDPATLALATECSDRRGRSIDGREVTARRVRSAMSRTPNQPITIDPDGTGPLPSLTRILDRSTDTLGRQIGTAVSALGSGTPEHFLTYDYDTSGRLASVTTATTTVSYTYDSQSRRVARTEGANTTICLYDAWNCLAEYVLNNSSFNLHTSLSRGLDLSGSLQGAGGVSGLLGVAKHEAQGISHFFPTYDGNGNVSEYLDTTGTIVAHFEYDPFGRTIVATGQLAGNFGYRFSTKAVDSSTGLYYYGYRWFDPETGRWFNRDPIEEPCGVNLYGFVGNDNVNSIDFFGLLGSPLDV